MANIDIYKQYFSADCTANGAARRGALVWLNAESDAGMIRYAVGVSFFPYRDAEDFAVSYNACGTKELLYTKGRRSKKRDAEYLAQVRTTADELAASLDGVIHWDEPLGEAQYG